MEKKDDQKSRDDLINEIRAFIQMVYTGDEELEGRYLQCLIREDAVPFDDAVSEDSEIPVECFKDRMIKVCSIEPDEIFAGYNIKDSNLAADGFDTDEIKKLIDEQEVTFAEALLDLIDKKGYSDPYVYRKANIDRKHFQKMKNPTYRPGKAAAISLGLALELDLDDLQTFIGRADHHLSRAFKTDIVIEYCIDHHLFDIQKINELLYELDLPGLSHY